MQFGTPPILEMSEEVELKPFIESISTKSLARILKIVRDAIGEERTQEDKSEIINLLNKKGECINSGLIAEPITTNTTMNATFEGAKATIILCWRIFVHSRHKTKSTLFQMQMRKISFLDYSHDK